MRVGARHQLPAVYATRSFAARTKISRYRLPGLHRVSAAEHNRDGRGQRLQRETAALPPTLLARADEVIE